MNQIYLYTKDKDVNFSYHIAHAMSQDFIVEIKPNQIVSTNAIKFIYEFNKVVSYYLFLSPIIKCNNKGDIQIWTSSSYDEILNLRKNVISKEEHKQHAAKFKFLKTKSRLGLSSEEIAEMMNLAAINEVEILKNKKAPLKIGGSL